MQSPTCILQICVILEDGHRHQWTKEDWEKYRAGMLSVMHSVDRQYHLQAVVWKLADFDVTRYITYCDFAFHYSD